MIRNPLAWCAWAIAALAAAFMFRNPLLQALLLLVIVNVWLPYRRDRPLHLRLGLLLAVIPILFSVALSRYGEHPVVVLPPIPIIGGAWTWEAALFGATSGMALMLTVAIFAVLQATVRSVELLSLLPPPLYRAGTAFALSLSFAPRTAGAFHSIIEARQLRGQQTAWRDAPRVVLPLLLTTLEQALQYGESLDARGYGSRHRSRYRPIGWSPSDFVLVLAAAASLLLALVAPPPSYNPYLSLLPNLPTIASLIAVLLLAIPAVNTAVSSDRHAAALD
jgi:energy-coupling factor transporter transmembrane protein EcfT